MASHAQLTLWLEQARSKVQRLTEEASALRAGAREAEELRAKLARERERADRAEAEAARLRVEIEQAAGTATREIVRAINAAIKAQSSRRTHVSRDQQGHNRRQPRA